MELFIQTLTTSSVVCGLLFSYITIGRWIRGVDCLRPAFALWYPKEAETIIYLFVILLHQSVYQAFLHWLTHYKTGFYCKDLFQHWLRTNSLVGWQSFVMASCTISL